MNKLPDERIQGLLKMVVNHFDQEDRSVRERQLRTSRQLKLLWEGFSRIWYDSVAHDWKIYEWDGANNNNDQAYYDKPINIFRAYLESIIAALSVNVPAIKCYPEDADNPLDISTAKAGDKISTLIYRHNNVPMMWLHALYIMCTETMMACYTYPKEDEKYGTYETSTFKDVLHENDNYNCSECNAEIPDEVMGENTIDPFHTPTCPSCGTILPADLQKGTYTTSELDKTEIHPKTRVCMECYGNLYVKVPNYAMRQEDIPYLIFSYETNYVNVLERYDYMRDKVTGAPKVGPASSGSYDPYERWARLSPQYRGEYPVNNVTVRNAWLRPAAFNYLSDEDCKELKALYPDGVKVVLANDEFCAAYKECLDTRWTLLYNPLSDYVQQQPIGSLLVNVQDITNEIISLTLQTMEHGISQTFADPGVLNFEEYRQTEAGPGFIYPAKPTSSKSLNDAFWQTKTASLSAEVMPFFQDIQTLGQSVSGAQPSLWGGQLSGSRTASEYSMSRAQALQRLQNSWKMLLTWWKDVFGKAIPMYIEGVMEDERSVEMDSQGNFVNVFVRKADLEGTIGKVELEANENLPITWSQRKDVYMSLMESQNPKVLEALSSPENIKNLAEAIGLDDFVVPGEADRQKQYEEIRQLINSEPLAKPPDEMTMMQAMLNGQPIPQFTEVSSVSVDPDVDNHDIEADICRTFLVSEAGRLLKSENPVAYKNVLLHMKEHMQLISQALMQQQQQANNPQTQSPDGTSTPLAEGQDVSTES